MFLTPPLIFLLVWILPLSAYYLVDSEVILELSSTTQYLVIANIVVFFLLTYFMRKRLKAHAADIGRTISARIKLRQLEKRTVMVLACWLIVYCINIFFSGGIPIYWIIIGDPRTYADFGLPTLGGLGNILRAFALTSCYFIYFHTKSNKRPRFLLIGLLLIASAFILETGRGNGVVLLLHPVAMYFLFNKLKLVRVLKSMIAVIAVLFVSGYVQLVRYDDGMEKLQAYAASSGFPGLSGPALLLVPAFTYIAVPIVNTDLNVVVAPILKFEPYFSVQGIVPTVLRNELFEPKDYGLLINEAHNVSSFYIPLIRDFGILGAFLAVTLIQAIVSYCYLRARQGYAFYCLIWPPLFMSLVLSFFSLYFTSLVVLLYPVVAFLFLKGLRIRSAVRQPVVSQGYRA